MVIYGDIWNITAPYIYADQDEVLREVTDFFYVCWNPCKSGAAGLQPLLELMHWESKWVLHHRSKGDDFLQDMHLHKRQTSFSGFWYGDCSANLDSHSGWWLLAHLRPEEFLVLLFHCCFCGCMGAYSLVYSISLHLSVPWLFHRGTAGGNRLYSRHDYWQGNGGLRAVQ